MVDICLMIDAFNYTVQNFDYLYSSYENNLIDLYHFVDNNIDSIEGSWSNSQNIKITPSYHSSLDSTEIKDIYVEWRNSVINSRVRLTLDINHMSNNYYSICNYPLYNLPQDSLNNFNLIPSNLDVNFNARVTGFNDSINYHKTIINYKWI